VTPTALAGRRTGDAGCLATGLATLYLRLFGWHVEGQLPLGTKAVAIAAPHTSNWDLPLMLAVSFVLGVKPSWLGKRELFWGPFGWLMRRLGGIPVDRGARTNLVRQVAERFAAVDQLFLVIPPSATRGRTTHWKSGFYHIARSASVPIICAFLDYRRKVGGVGPTIVPTGDVRADMRPIREFYAGVTSKHPAITSCVRLLEEDDEPLREACQA
jgi:1-acyl-sn-glycerol-3-phosphate acyltransferase